MLNRYLNRPIMVYRRDDTRRLVMIMLDESTNKYCFVNLTTFHVCKCRFDAIEDALDDLANQKDVVSYTIYNGDLQVSVSVGRLKVNDD